MQDKSKIIAMWKGKQASRIFKENVATCGYCLQDTAEGPEKDNIWMTRSIVVLYDSI